MQPKKFTMDMNCKHVECHAVFCLVLRQKLKSSASVQCMRTEEDSNAISRKYGVIFMTFDYFIFDKISSVSCAKKSCLPGIWCQVIKYSFLPQQTVPISRLISHPCYEVSVNQPSAVNNHVFSTENLHFSLFSL